MRVNRYATLFVVGSFAIIVLVGACSMHAWRDYDLSEPFTDVLEAGRGILRYRAETAEFRVHGHFSGSGYLFLIHVDPDILDVEYFHPDTLGRFGIRVPVAGDIDFTSTSLWYFHKVWVVFIPVEPGSGNVRVRFRLMR